MRMRISRNHSEKSPAYPQTRQRQLLLEIIRRTEGHIDAKGLVKLASERDRSISAATVYRNLSLFKKLGLIEEQHLGGARCYYEIRRSPQHQHLVCSECGRVFDFACPLSELVDQVKKDYSFIVTKAEVYLEGHCAECTSKTGKTNSEEGESNGPGNQ